MKDKACASTLFSPIEMRRFLSSFDTDEFEKLSQCEGFGEPRFRKWLLKIGQFRENAQNYAKFRETGSTCLKVTSASSGNNKINRNYKQVQPSLVAFKHSRRYENCRICNHLSKMGDTRMLYDNHNSNYPSGCPRFIAMCILKSASKYVKMQRFASDATIHRMFGNLLISKQRNINV